MSLAVGNLAISTAQIVLLNRFSTKASRSMGSLVAQVVIRERHRDDSDITDHPVERGVVVADHVIPRPAEVVIECGWSNSPASGSYIQLTPSRRAMTVQEVYQALLKMKNDRELVDVLTGKRKYQNMLLKTIEVETDREKENILSVVATFRELRIVGTIVLSLAPSTDEAKQEDPAITAPTLNGGTKQLQSAPLYNPQAGP